MTPSLSKKSDPYGEDMLRRGFIEARREQKWRFFALQFAVVILLCALLSFNNPDMLLHMAPPVGLAMICKSDYKATVLPWVIGTYTVVVTFAALLAIGAKAAAFHAVLAYLLALCGGLAVLYFGAFRGAKAARPSDVLWLAGAGLVQAGVLSLAFDLSTPVQPDGDVLQAIPDAGITLAAKAAWLFDYAWAFLAFMAVVPTILLLPDARAYDDYLAGLDTRYTHKIYTHKITLLGAKLLAGRTGIRLRRIDYFVLGLLATLWLLSCAFGGISSLALPLFGAIIAALFWGPFLTSLVVCVAISLMQGFWLLGGYDAVDSDMLASLLAAAGLTSLLPLLISLDVKRRDALTEELRHLALHDSLTGQINRAGLEECVAQALRQMRSSLTVMVLDCDNFKAINDRWGHAAGDQVICAFAARLKASLRRGDLLARIGGDEFAVVLRDVSFAQSVLIAERLRLVIERRPLSIASVSDPIQTTLSLGLTTYDAAAAEGGGAIGSAETGTHSVKSLIEPLLAEADRALYSAKKAGRNRVAFIRQDPL